MRELYVIFHGLRIVDDVGHQIIIIIESDSKVVIDLIMLDTQPLHPYAPLIKQISLICRQDWDVSFHHTLCQGNERANWLVKYGASSKLLSNLGLLALLNCITFQC